MTDHLYLFKDSLVLADGVPGTLTIFELQDDPSLAIPSTSPSPVKATLSAFKHESNHPPLYHSPSASNLQNKFDFETGKNHNSNDNLALHKSISNNQQTQNQHQKELAVDSQDTYVIVIRWTPGLSSALHEHEEQQDTNSISSSHQASSDIKDTSLTTTSNTITTTTTTTDTQYSADKLMSPVLDTRPPLQLHQQSSHQKPSVLQVRLLDILTVEVKVDKRNHNIRGEASQPYIQIYTSGAKFFGNYRFRSLEHLEMFLNVMRGYAALNLLDKKKSPHLFAVERLGLHHRVKQSYLSYRDGSLWEALEKRKKKKNRKILKRERSNKVSAPNSSVSSSQSLSNAPVSAYTPSPSSLDITLNKDTGPVKLSTSPTVNTIDEYLTPSFGFSVLEKFARITSAARTVQENVFDFMQLDSSPLMNRGQNDRFLTLADIRNALFDDLWGVDKRPGGRSFPDDEDEPLLYQVEEDENPSSGLLQDEANIASPQQNPPPRSIRIIPRFYKANEPRGKPITTHAWDALFDPLSGVLKNYLVAKYAIFSGGVHPDARYQVWPFILNVFQWESSAQERKSRQQIIVQEYNRIKDLVLQKKQQYEQNNDLDNPFMLQLNQIQKDIVRTDRFVDAFGEDSPLLDKMWNILAAYAFRTPHIGYCQGMSDILSPIVYSFSGHDHDEELSFACFENLMINMNKNFRTDQTGIQQDLAALRRLIRNADRDLSSFFEETDPEFHTCFRWILVQFKRELPFEEILRLWEVLWLEWVGGHDLHLYIAAAILIQRKGEILSLPRGSFDQMLRYINDLAMKIDVDLAINSGVELYERVGPLEGILQESPPTSSLLEALILGTSM